MSSFASHWHTLSRLLVTLPVLFLMAACRGQVTARPNSIPVTGLVSPTPVIAASPGAAPTGTPQSGPTQAAARSLDCQSPAALTPALTEGPYFKAGSPERSSLLDPGMPGVQLTLTGYVLTADCQPVAHALLDFWQADSQGQYDNAGFTLRGHEYTDQNGRYQLETVIPGLYPGRTEHIHVKVQAPGGPLLTTQLFFPGVEKNQSDSIYDPALLVKLQGSGAHMQAAFDFVIGTK
jgi:protocatechuate 3,4-dioxygenase beta subunit